MKAAETTPSATRRVRRRLGMIWGTWGERSDWDSNPGESFEAPYTLSRRAPSTTRTSLQTAAGILAWAVVGVNSAHHARILGAASASLQPPEDCDTLMRQ